MKETILRITEVFDRRRDNTGTYDGYDVVTSKRTLFLGISNSQQCCERWGYLTTPDDPNEFVGAELIAVNLFGESISGKREQVNFESEDTNAEFINVETDRGTLQFALYNYHNGYYGHTCVVFSDEQELLQSRV